jgi:hypothetical protein
MTCSNYLATPELSSEEKTFFEKTQSDAEKALALIKEQLAAHTSPANLKQDLVDLQAQIKTAKPLLAALKSGEADDKAMETVSGLLVAVDNWLALVAMTPEAVQKAFGAVVAQLTGNKVVLSGLLDKIETSTPKPEKWRYNFTKTLEEYEKNCADGSLTAELAKDLISKMEAAIEEEITDLTTLKKNDDINPSDTLKVEIEALQNLIAEHKEKLAPLDKSCFQDTAVVRFILEDIGSPKEIEPGKWRVKRVIKYNPKATKLKYQQKNIHAHTETPSKGIGKIADGLYDDVRAAFNWQTRKKATEMAEKGIEEDFIWVEWVEKKVLPTDVKVGKALPKRYQIGEYIYPDEGSDYVSIKGGDMLAVAKKMLQETASVLNDAFNSNQIKGFTISIRYNCGIPSGMTGNDCEIRAKKGLKNTIKRLIEFGLKIPKANIKQGDVDAFQKVGENLGIHITIIPY